MSRVYRIVLRGHVPDRLLAPYIDEFTIDRTDTTTTLTGAIVDSAHLNGVVIHLTAVGVELVELGQRPSRHLP